VKDLIEPKAAYFHMVAWFLPLVLTIIIMAINRVDASNLYGNVNVQYRYRFVIETVSFAKLLKLNDNFFTGFCLGLHCSLPTE
jgi:hypothetical protein